MVKGRRIHYLDRKRKRSENSIETAITPVKQERNVLNDALINLYKKDMMTEKEIDSEDKSDVPENQLKSENVENLKTPEREMKKRRTVASVPTVAFDDVGMEETMKLKTKNTGNLKTTGREKKRTAPVASVPTVTFDDVGGMEETLETIVKVFSSAFIEPENRLCPSRRGVLLHGPPGCGKTLIARAIAGQLKVPLLEVMVTELVRGISGESERKIRDTFETAIATGRCLLFFDNLEVICSKAMMDSPMVSRMVDQLLACLDDLVKKDPLTQVLVVGTINDLEATDVKLQGSERFSLTVPIGVPDIAGRLKIMEVLCKDMKMSPECSLEWLAKRTPGFIGGDLKELFRVACEFAYQRVPELYKSHLKQGDTENLSELLEETDSPNVSEYRKALARLEVMKNAPKEVYDNLHLVPEDFEKALNGILPFALKRGSVPVDKVSWEDVGALTEVKRELQKNIVEVADGLVSVGKSGGTLKHRRPSSTPATPKTSRSHLGEVQPSKSLRYDSFDHMPDHDNSKHETRCKNENCTYKTNIFCLKCNVHLCLKRGRNCFKTFHENK